MRERREWEGGKNGRDTGGSERKKSAAQRSKLYEASYDEAYIRICPDLHICKRNCLTRPTSVVYVYGLSLALSVAVCAFHLFNVAIFTPANKKYYSPINLIN